eukprot:TRINITY_DN4462_c0_g3_i1.p1 TRINITY_DN4462_c0_g3~~TRINITY_DN4462_c0_g3_i1.p1  ORF type:complete len:563 (-),score=125.07 TRINITY_DN4462_c0_g3_i1:181-1869(-)
MTTAAVMAGELYGEMDDPGFLDAYFAQEPHMVASQTSSAARATLVPAAQQSALPADYLQLKGELVSLRTALELERTTTAKLQMQNLQQKEQHAAAQREQALRLEIENLKRTMQFRDQQHADLVADLAELRTERELREKQQRKVLTVHTRVLSPMHGAAVATPTSVTPVQHPTGGPSNSSTISHSLVSGNSIQAHQPTLSSAAPSAVPPANSTTSSASNTRPSADVVMTDVCVETDSFSSHIILSVDQSRATSETLALLTPLIAQRLLYLHPENATALAEGTVTVPLLCALLSTACISGDHQHSLTVALLQATESLLVDTAATQRAALLSGVRHVPMVLNFAFRGNCAACFRDGFRVLEAALWDLQAPDCSLFLDVLAMLDAAFKRSEVFGDIYGDCLPVVRTIFTYQFQAGDDSESRQLLQTLCTFIAQDFGAAISDKGLLLRRDIVRLLFVAVTEVRDGVADEVCQSVANAVLQLLQRVVDKNMAPRPFLNQILQEWTSFLAHVVQLCTHPSVYRAHILALVHRLTSGYLTRNITRALLVALNEPDDDLMDDDATQTVTAS